VDEQHRVMAHGVHVGRVEGQRARLADVDAQAAAFAPVACDEDWPERGRATRKMPEWGIDEWS